MTAAAGALTAAEHPRPNTIDPASSSTAVNYRPPNLSLPDQGQ